jgi:pimeloyl-ACP methyl ester carboxylesterase
LKTTEKESVVLVPGFLMGGVSMSLLKHRMRTCGFDAHRFAYFSAWLTVAQNAALLNRYLGSVRSSTVHFVCHSLGGLVIRHLFAAYPDQRPGRVVTLGTPHQGSHVARELARTPLRLFLGRALRQGLAGGAPVWDANRELGVIAGRLPIGLGTFLASVQRPNDGTVEVEETKLPGTRCHAVLPVSHVGLLLAPSVARYACVFLKTGTFPSEVTPSGPRERER